MSLLNSVIFKVLNSVSSGPHVCSDFRRVVYSLYRIWSLRIPSLHGLRPSVGTGVTIPKHRLVLHLASSSLWLCPYLSFALSDHLLSSRADGLKARFSPLSKRNAVLVFVFLISLRGDWQ